jgi:hypothetical protein
MMEAVRISETSVYLYEITRSHATEGCRLDTRRRENLKLHMYKLTKSAKR